MHGFGFPQNSPTFFILPHIPLYCCLPGTSYLAASFFGWRYRWTQLNQWLYAWDVHASCLPYAHRASGPSPALSPTPSTALPHSPPPPPPPPAQHWCRAVSTTNTLTKATVVCLHTSGSYRSEMQFFRRTNKILGGFWARCCHLRNLSKLLVCVWAKFVLHSC